MVNPHAADSGPHVEQAVVRHLLTAEDLDQIRDADTSALIDATGQPVTIVAANTYRDAGVLTLDRGVWLELSDGSQFGLTRHRLPPTHRAGGHPAPGIR